MNFSTGTTALSASINMAEQRRILNHIKQHPSEEGALAKKAYNRNIIITLLIIFLIMIPSIVIGIVFTFDLADNPKYPDGATKEVRGHISLYEDTFWYTDSSQKYEFSFEDYNIDSSYEPGEVIIIYLDDNNNIVSVAHEKDNDTQAVASMVLGLVLMFVVPIVFLLTHAFIAQKTYCKWWSLYAQWYEKEIEPLRFADNFEELIADKKFYDVTVKVKDLSPRMQKKYKKYQIINVLLWLLLVAFIVVATTIFTKIDLSARSGLGFIIIAAFVLPFCVVKMKYEAKMREIKYRHLDKVRKQQQQTSQTE